MWLVLCVFLVLVSGKELTDEEYSQLPRLFHLDDYEACLARRGGLYCLGSFRLVPRTKDDAVYAMMLEYSATPQHFNRTRVHRGYCVSSRCPLAERNNTWRFESCMQRWAHSRGFRSTPDEIEYCRTTEQAAARKTTELDTPMIIFVAVVFCLLLVNAVSTFYDLMTPDGEKSKKNKILVAWSVKSNWRRLTANYEEGDPRLSALSPLQGVRVFIMVLVIILHSGLFYYMVYTHNTRSLENMMKLPFMVLMRNGTSLVEVFVVLSSFLLAYHLLLYSSTHQLGFRVLPKIWINRIIRLSPLHLLAVGFVATWWTTLGDGPMWYMVENSAGACRRKFWTHFFFLHNILDPDDQCLTQTWFLAVDMQLTVVASVLALLLARRRGRALLVLGTLIVASSVANGLLAYYYEWTTLFYIMTAENQRTIMRGQPSFNWYYAAPWGSLPASLIGLFLAFLHIDLQEKGFKVADHKWLVLLCHCSIPLTLCFVVSGSLVAGATSRAFLATYVALERPVYSLLCACCLFGILNNVDNIVRRFYAWRGFQALGRLSLAALLLHWLLELGLRAASPLPLAYSHLGLFCGYLATLVLTYVLSVPLTLMVEMPFQRMFAAIFA